MSMSLTRCAPAAAVCERIDVELEAGKPRPTQQLGRGLIVCARLPGGSQQVRARGRVSRYRPLADRQRVVALDLHGPDGALVEAVLGLPRCWREPLRFDSRRQPYERFGLARAAAGQLQRHEPIAVRDARLPSHQRAATRGQDDTGALTGSPPGHPVGVCGQQRQAERRLVHPRAGSLATAGETVQRVRDLALCGEVLPTIGR